MQNAINVIDYKVFGNYYNARALDRGVTHAAEAAPANAGII